LVRADVYWRPELGGRGADDMNVGIITSLRDEWRRALSG